MISMSMAEPVRRVPEAISCSMSELQATRRRLAGNEVTGIAARAGRVHEERGLVPARGLEGEIHVFAPNRLQPSQRSGVRQRGDPRRPSAQCIEHQGVDERLLVGECR